MNDEHSKQTDQAPGKRGAAASPVAIEMSQSSRNLIQGSGGDEEAPFKPRRGQSILRQIWSVILQILVVSFPFMFLGLVCYLVVPHRQYSILEAQNGLPLSWSVEIFRLSLLASLTYSAYVLSNHLVDWTINLIRSIPRTFKFVPLSKRFLEKLNYLKGIEAYLSSLMFWSAFYLLSRLLVVDNSPRADLGGDLAGSPASRRITDLLAQVASGQGQGYVYCYHQALLVIAMYWGFVTLEKLGIQIVGVKFHKEAFAGRFGENKRQMAIIESLLRVCLNYSRNKTVNRHAPSLADDDPHDTLEAISMFDGDDPGYYSQAEATQDASFIYATLTDGEDRDIVPDDFQRFFDDHAEAFALFDTDGSKTITRSEMTRTVCEAYEERRNIRKGIKSHGRIVAKLDRMASAIVTVCTGILGLSVFGISLSAQLASLGTTALTFTFVFSKYLTDMFEALMYVFSSHLYDEGDRVVLDSEMCTVERIDVMTTSFRRWDGQMIAVPTKNLVSKNIYNIRRSGFQSEVFEVQIESLVTMAMIQDLRTRIIEGLDPKEFSGKLTVRDFGVDGSKAKLCFAVEHMGNFQNVDIKTDRHNMAKETIRGALQAAGIEQYRI